MTVYQKLLSVQGKLKAPKGQFNSFGKYKYRSCEDILESVKPLCVEAMAVLTISDSIAQIGERYYIRATATFTDVESGESISNTAYAREEDNKKGMDASQVTGTASSYARKYALNGLFCIDDTKDADTDEHHAVTNKTEKPAKKEVEPPQKELERRANEGWVKREDGKTMVLAANGEWYFLERIAMSLESLNKIANDSKYKACHDECRRLLMEKSK